MIRDITIGQYYPANSIIHRLDPRVKLFATMLFVISLFLKKSVYTYALATVFLFGMIGVSRVPIKYIFRGLKVVFFLLLFSCLMNLFFTRGDTIWWQWKFLTISKEGVVNAAFMGVRLVYLVIGSSLMLRIPVHEFAMMMSIALRFIPILTEELDKIMKAQAARCAQFEEGNLIQRAKSLVPVMIPLFVSAIRRANDLALAMEVRCYQGGEGRTKLYPLQYEKRDRIAYAVVAVYLFLMIALKWLDS